MSTSFIGLYSFAVFAIFSMNISPTHAYIPYTCRGQKRALDPLELEWWVIVRCYMEHMKAVCKSTK